MRKLNYILLSVFLFPSIVYSASGVMLVNPPALYFSQGDAKSLTAVKAALIDAFDVVVARKLFGQLIQKSQMLLSLKLL